MTDHADDLVRIAQGHIVQIEMYQLGLQDAGIESRVVGQQLDAGLGTALPDSIELWVHAADVEKANATIALMEAERGRERPEHLDFDRPESDPRPHQPDVPRPHTHYDPDPRS